MANFSRALICKNIARFGKQAKGGQREEDMGFEMTPQRAEECMLQWKRSTVTGM